MGEGSSPAGVKTTENNLFRVSFVLAYVIVNNGGFPGRHGPPGLGGKKKNYPILGRAR